MASDRRVFRDDVHAVLCADIAHTSSSFFIRLIRDLISKVEHSMRPKYRRRAMKLSRLNNLSNKEVSERNNCADVSVCPVNNRR